MKKTKNENVVIEPNFDEHAKKVHKTWYKFSTGQ